MLPACRSPHYCGIGRRLPDTGSLRIVQLSEMGTRIHSARLLTWHAAQLQSAGEPFTLQAAQAKLAASEAATFAAHQCIQVSPRW